MKPIISPEYLFLLSPLIIVGVYLTWIALDRASALVRVSASGFRFVALSFLLIVACDPGEWVNESDSEDSVWYVLLDKSKSMQETDDDDISRWDDARNLLTDLATQKSVDFRHYVFDKKLELLKTGSQDQKEILSSIKPDGDSTDICGALGDLIGRSAGRNVSGVILLTDGRQVEEQQLSQTAFRARAAGIPVFPVPFGARVEKKMLEIEPLRKHYLGFGEQLVPVHVKVSNVGLGKIRPLIQLVDDDNQVVAEEKIFLEDGESKEVEFAIRPGGAGFHEYKITGPKWSRKQNDFSSSQESRFSVTSLKSKIRILSLEGNPHWDSKFLVQLLRQQSYLDVASLHRVSGDRFFHVGDGGDQSSKNSLSENIPNSLEDWKYYDVIVVGKGIEYFVDYKKVNLLKDYVQEHGGCILFCRGKPYHDTFEEIEEIEPLKWDRINNNNFYWRPASLAVNRDYFLEGLPPLDSPTWKHLSPVVNVRKATLKPFSQSLIDAWQSKRGRPTPAVAYRRSGKGLVITVNSEGMWQWDFFPQREDSRAFYRRFWIQLLQWASTYNEYLPGHNYALSVNRSSVDAGEPVWLSLSYRGKEKVASEKTVSLYKDNKLYEKYDLEMDSDQQGQWSSILNLSDPGTYKIYYSDGKENETYVMLHVEGIPGEEDELSSDEGFLKNLASLSGGKLLSSSDCVKFINEHEDNKTSMQTNKEVWESSWDRWWLALIIVACFSSEWIIRRRNGIV